MRTIVVSDVHLGSRYLNAGVFLRFLDNLPPGTTLVLNGDVVNRNIRALPDGHKEALNRIRSLSAEIPVAWIRGNHDERFFMEDPGGISFADSLQVDGRLCVIHGHEFRNRITRQWPLALVFRALNLLKRHSRAEPAVTIACVKQLSFLHRIVCRHVALNAVEHAREKGVPAVTCGHTHLIEDLQFDGIRYMNTGSWLSNEAGFLDCSDDEITLKHFA